MESDWDTTITVGIEPDARVEDVLADEQVTRLKLEFLLPRKAFRKTLTMVAKRKRPHLTALALVHRDHDPGGEPGKPLVAARSMAKLWRQLPALVHLEIVGHSLLADVAHPGLTHLRMVGYPIGDSGPASADRIDTPALHHLTWRFAGDRHGVAFPPSALEPLWSNGRLTSLRELDLSGADLDGALVTQRRFLESRLVAGLDHLVWPRGEVEPEELEAALPHLTHLSKIGVANPACAAVDPRVEVLPPPEEPPVVQASSRLYFANATDAQLRQAAERGGPVETIEATWHKLSPAGLASLGTIAAANPGLTSIDLTQNLAGRIGGEGISRFVEALGAPHPGLKALRWGFNRFEEAGEALGRLVAHTPALEVLELTLSYLADAEQPPFVAALNEASSLRELDVTKVRGGPIGAAAWSTFRAEHLERFDYSGIKQAPDDQARVFDRLGERLPALRQLELTMAPLHATGLTSLARGVQQHDSLSDLAIAVEPTAAALATFGDVLAAAPIRSLQLEVPDLPGDEAPEAIGSLQRGETIETLRFIKRLSSRDPDLAARQTAAALDAIAALPRLHTLVNPPTSGDPVVIADRLATTSVRTYGRCVRRLIEPLLERDAIERLYFQANTHRLAETLGWMAGIASANTSLHTLRLEGAELDAEAVKQLVALVTKRKTVRRVEVCAWLDNDERFSLIDRFRKLAHVEVLAIDPFGERLGPAVDEWLADKGGLQVEAVDPREHAWVWPALRR
jgi:hypothetical protein